MEEQIIAFITALRAAGVRVSLAESADALAAVARLGVTDRDAFRLALCATLVKDARHRALFDELFAVFFSADEAPPRNVPGELTAEEAEQLAQALQQAEPRLRPALERLVHGDPLQREELDQFSAATQPQPAADLGRPEARRRRAAQALRAGEVSDALQKLQQALAELGMSEERSEQVHQALQANQAGLEDQLGQHMGRRMAEDLSRQQRNDSDQSLVERPFAVLSQAELAQLRREVRRMAALLRSRVALRQKRARSGQLDAKATIRTNLKHGSVPMQLVHRDRRLKPRLVILCDLSTSMRFCSELMLALVQALQDQISKTHAFAYINWLEYISPYLAGRETQEVIGDVLRRMPGGHYNTDLGYCLEQFAGGYLDTVDSRTTLIVVSDARNNYNDPRLDLFDGLVRRSRRTIWLNPEAPHLWITGDSDMPQYAALCDAVLQVSSLAELTKAVDRLLTYR